jgi:hypothetical protein
LEAENGCGTTLSGRRQLLSAPFRPGLLVLECCLGDALVLLFWFVSCYSQCEFQSVQQIISGSFDLSIRLGKFATHRSNNVGTAPTGA